MATDGGFCAPLVSIPFKREFDCAISAARRAAEMAQKGAPRVARGTFLRIRRIHVSFRQLKITVI
ncbi:MAG TPA: hypothetical protein V6C78_31450 [Crinalium sp.]|jgi:hypothetical protein